MGAAHAVGRGPHWRWDCSGDDLAGCGRDHEVQRVLSHGGPYRISAASRARRVSPLFPEDDAKGYVIQRRRMAPFGVASSLSIQFLT